MDIFREKFISDNQYPYYISLSTGFGSLGNIEIDINDKLTGDIVQKENVNFEDKPKDIQIHEQNLLMYFISGSGWLKPLPDKSEVLLTIEILNKDKKCIYQKTINSNEFTFLITPTSKT